jgi:hypothetical protein
VIFKLRDDTDEHFSRYAKVFQAHFMNGFKTGQAIIVEHQILNDKFTGTLHSNETHITKVLHANVYLSCRVVKGKHHFFCVAIMRICVGDNGRSSFIIKVRLPLWRSIFIEASIYETFKTDFCH